VVSLSQGRVKTGHSRGLAGIECRAFACAKLSVTVVTTSLREVANGIHSIGL